jgi:CheY-like chemotaxis protein
MLAGVLHRSVAPERRPPSSARGVPPSKRPLPKDTADSPLILVVDDFEDNRELYAGTLEEAGYAVEQATNGQEALEKIGSVRPAIIIMDLSMPILDGWEATRRIKADPHTADIVVVALTGHATNYGLQQARDAGAHAVLTKPCLPGDLLALIRTLTLQ